MSQLPDNPVADWLDTLVNIVTANLLWLLTSVLVVTIPMATAGLFAVLTPRIHGEKPEAFTTFFDALRSHWRKSTLFGGLDVLLGGWVFANLLIIQQMGPPSLLTVLIGAVNLLVALYLLLVNLYFWPLLVTLDQPFKTLLANSFKLATAHPFWSLLVAAGVVAIGVLVLVLPGVVTVIVAFAGAALWISWGSWRIISRYMEDMPAA